MTSSDCDAVDGSHRQHRDVPHCSETSARTLDFYQVFLMGCSCAGFSDAVTGV